MLTKQTRKWLKMTLLAVCFQSASKLADFQPPAVSDALLDLPDVLKWQKNKVE